MIPTSPANLAAVASSSSVRAAPPTLLSVLASLEHRRDLSPNRRRDLRQSGNFFGSFLSSRTSITRAPRPRARGTEINV